MTKRADGESQSPHHVMIFDSDWAFLIDQYGPYSDSRKGAGWAVRQMVHRQVAWLRAKEQERRDARRSAEAQALEQRLESELEDAS